MDQHVGPPGQGDDLLGGLAGQDDQAVAVLAELRPVALARPRPARRPGRNAPRGRRRRPSGKASIRIGTPWFGWTMLPMYMITLCSGPMPGIVGRSPGWSYSPRSIPG